MTNLRERLVESVDRARESGRDVTIDPAMAPAEIDALAARCGGLPADIRAVVEYTAGFSIDGFIVRFVGDYPFEFEAIFPCSIPIATDNAGNFWVVDAATGGEWGPVFYVVHDPPVTMLQARDIGSFIDQISDAQPAKLAETAVALISKDNPYAISRSQARSSSDPAVRTFAQRIDDRFAIVDLRAREQGAGFVWGTAGPNTEVRRDGERLLFAVEQKKRGLLARMFSR